MINKMLSILGGVHRQISQLGYCTRCMRKSYLLAVAGLCLVVVMTWFEVGKAAPLLYFGACGFAASLLLLFVSHIIAFSVRSGIRATRLVNGHNIVGDAGGVDASRRGAMALFVRGAAFGLTAGTVSVVAPRSSFAYYICGNGTNGMRCNDDTICCFNNQYGSYYCCWANTRCGGDGYCY